MFSASYKLYVDFVLLYVRIALNRIVFGCDIVTMTIGSWV